MPPALPRQFPIALLAAAMAVGACGSESRPTPTPTPTPEPQDGGTEPTSPAPPPDGGTEQGHGVEDAERRSNGVAVPREEDTPPSARIVLGRADGTPLASATVYEDPGGQPVRLATRRFVATTTGEDAESGIARVRVSLAEELVCRGPGGETFRRPRIRYFPPPQIENIRAAPGARLRTRAGRSLTLSLSARHCGRDGELVTAHAEVWGEAINGLGLEAVTRHVRFTYRAGVR